MPLLNVYPDPRFERNPPSAGASATALATGETVAIATSAARARIFSGQMRDASSTALVASPRYAGGVLLRSITWYGSLFSLSNPKPSLGIRWNTLPYTTAANLDAAFEPGGTTIMDSGVASDEAGPPTVDVHNWPMPDQTPREGDTFPLGIYLSASDVYLAVFARMPAVAAQQVFFSLNLIEGITEAEALDFL